MLMQIFIEFIEFILTKIKKSLTIFKAHKGLALIIVIFSLTLVIVGIFFDRFNFNLNTPLKNWVDTAVYINNILSPILLSATVLLLYWTWKDTKRGLDLQRSDILYTSVIGTLERSSNELKIELENCQIKELDEVDFKANTKLCIEDLGRDFLNERLRRHSNKESTIDSKQRVIYVDVIWKSTIQINAFGTVLNQLYSVLSNPEHKNAFKVNLYSLFSVYFLIGFLIIQIRFKHIKEKLDDAELIEEEDIINLVKEATLIAYEGTSLDEELFDDKFVNEYLENYM